MRNIPRAGHYPVTIAADMTPERLGRHFVKTDSGYRIRKSIRDMVVFARQNVIKDPPFTRLDLLSCRNLMIYPAPELQERLIATFHYALKPDGVLFLSPSEHVGEHVDEHSALFTTLNRKWTLYRAAQSRPAPRVFRTQGLPWARLANDFEFARKAQVETTPDPAEMTRDMLLRSFAPAAVLVNARGDIRYVHGDTEKYLRAAPGHATPHVVSMARLPLQLEMYSALQTAAEPGIQITREIAIERGSAPPRVGICVLALPNHDRREHLLLITVQDLPPLPDAPVAQRGKRIDANGEAKRIETLERDLTYTREKLHTIIEEQQALNEELTATTRVREAREKAARHLAESIVDTVREPMLVLDGDLQVVTASRAFQAYFALTADDTVGHLIYALGTRQFDIPKLRELLGKVLVQDNAFKNFSITVDVAGLGPRTLRLDGRRIIAAEDATPLILLVLDTANAAS